MKLQILAIAAHPDDIELSCSGTLIKHAQMGQAIGIVDLTRGELGTRGTPELRIEESADAAKLMGVAVRENANMRDGFFKNDEEHQLRIITYIRAYQPDIIIANALADRHPDHGRAGRLVADSCFLAGLRKVATIWEGKEQQPWRPKRVFHMIQDRFAEPSFVVDISIAFTKKMEAIQCYKSQFHDPLSKEPQTYLTTAQFLKNIEGRDALMGKRIGVTYGEGFTSENIPGISNLDSLLLPGLP